ncbi:uncharacterized protein LY79DRAFT_652591 [Colletotrichum navitas]|uniref:Uncharacterized protein n=1 Tax=Colletotrichum navitas TaxID=681940 RepID=A0AAD8V028_9PEZI|nr:uncharacterized protein LY79DRAFT_652591 [Colletotrichum navitas]KAK1574317.1 hypothetical protein LY79DRAFT_652591 [Colletotrichum navitas]
METNDSMRAIARNPASMSLSKAKSIYENPKVRCVLAIDGTFYGYRDDLAANLDKSIDFATTFTYIYGPSISPEIRIDLEGTEKRGTRIMTYTIARLTIPINALRGDISIAEGVKIRLTDKELCYPVLLLSVSLKRGFVSKYKRPITPTLIKRSSAWIKCLVGTGEADLSVILETRGVGDSFVNLMTWNYPTEDIRVVDAGLDCVFKNQPMGYKQLDWFIINPSLMCPPDDPIPETMVFHDERTRMIRLQASSREEYDLEATKATLLAESTHPCILLPDLSSVWEADGSPPAYVAPPDRRPILSPNSR